MKNHQHISIIAAMSLLTSCTGKPAAIPVGGIIDLTVEATFPAVPYLQNGSSGQQFSWAYGDRISLLHGSESYYLECTKNGEGALFKGKAVKLPDGENYMAVFPYRPDYLLLNGSVVLDLPSTLPLSPDEGIPYYGTALLQDGRAEFKHAAAYLHYTISRNDIKSIAISSADKSVNLASPCGCIAGTYTVAVPAGRYNSFTVNMQSSEGSCERKIEINAKVPEGTVADLGTLDADAGWQHFKTPSIRLLRTTSSTIAASWSISNFQSPETDLEYDWSIGIYEDSQCRQLRVSWDISASQFTTPEGSILNLEGFFCPSFIFTGLENARNYFIKAWYTSVPECTSEVLAARTLHSSNVTLDGTASGNAGPGTVLLSEDFSEVIWGGDFAGRCWSYTDSNAATAPAFDNAVGTNPVGEQIIGGFTHKFTIANPSIEEGLFSTMKNAVRKTRLKDWASISEDASKSRVCSRSGYVKLGGGSKCGGIVTPSLNCLASKSRIRVSFKAHPYRALANDNIRIKVMAISTPEGSLKSDGTYTNNYSIGASVMITPSADLEWKEYSAELDVSPGEKVAIYTQRASGVSSGQARVLLDDIKLEYL